MLVPSRSDSCSCYYAIKYFLILLSISLETSVYDLRVSSPPSSLLQLSVAAPISDPVLLYWQVTQVQSIAPLH